MRQSTRKSKARHFPGSFVSFLNDRHFDCLSFLVAFLRWIQEGVTVEPLRNDSGVTFQ